MPAANGRTPVITVIPVGRPQVDQAAAALAAAFLHYPWFTDLVPDEARRLRALRTFGAVTVRYARRHGESLTTPGVDGVACWLPPERPWFGTFGMLRAGAWALPLRLGWRGFQKFL